MGPIASLVRRHVLLDLPQSEWFWQLRGYSARHAAAVERDVAVWEAWRAIVDGLQLLFRDRDESRRWLTHRHPALAARPIDRMLDGGEGLAAVRRLATGP